MRIVKTFRFRVYPTRTQADRLKRWNDAQRFLWNIALEQRVLGMARHGEARRFPSAFDQQRELTELRAGLPWLADVPRGVANQLLFELHMAAQRHLAGLSKRPRWKRKGQRLSFCEPNIRSWRLNGGVLRFPKLGGIRVVVDRPLEGRPLTCTIKADADQWFACIACEIDLPDTYARRDTVVAIDRGLVSFAGDSDGRLVPAPAFHEQALRRLARLERDVTRKRVGSNNRCKATLRVARLRRKVRRQRDHFLHVLSHDYAKNHGVVVIERLNVADMLRVGGTLSRRMADAGWSRFANMLGYKLLWSGGALIEVTAAFSSQTCSECGCVDPANRKTQSVFHCTACGHHEHADLNAPKVLKARVNRSGKPAEGTALEAARRSRKRVAPLRGRLKAPTG